MPVVESVVCEDEKQAFRLCFQHSLRRCVEMGFSPEESFGVVWEETLERVDIRAADQRLMFLEMLDWTRARMH